MIAFLTGILLPLSLLLVGGSFLIAFHGLPFRRPRKLFAALLQKNPQSGISPRQALLTALAGTLGVGNISGVASAVTLGGAGALFWMWLFALIAMVVKYAEIVLALHKGQNGHGGAMYYISRKPIALLFSLLLIACGFAMGNLVQVRAAKGAVDAVLPKLSPLVGPLFALLLFPILLRGKTGVFRFAEKAVPLMTLVYCALSVVFLLRMRHHLPDAFARIFSLAFSTKSLGGALVGSGLTLGLRYGAVRGMISNEAGCGTAPIAHAACQNHPAAQGCFGIAEVFIDTLLLCTLTGLCVLVAPAQSGDGTAILFGAFATRFGALSSYLLCPAMILFAFATTVCWYYYIRESLHFLCGSERFDKVLAVLFCLCCMAAGLFAEEKLFVTTDLLICGMAFCNLPSLIVNWKSISRLTREYFENPNH